MKSQDKIRLAVELLKEVSVKCDRGQFFNNYPSELASFDEVIMALSEIELHDDIDKV